eukprot:TRINITY_DN66617_c3_g1_i1.p1 TRINITY_DN66617_c3_g1~~TRINITY_DN66617_c3_g1_i1.p1  ORF type:complete len:174 (-),score=2.20 TRINITY_DN66617_c3_g1_i1:28-549(-)
MILQTVKTPKCPWGGPNLRLWNNLPPDDGSAAWRKKNVEILFQGDVENGPDCSAKGAGCAAPWKLMFKPQFTPERPLTICISALSGCLCHCLPLCCILLDSCSFFCPALLLHLATAAGTSWHNLVVGCGDTCVAFIGTRGTVCGGLKHTKKLPQRPPPAASGNADAAGSGQWA